MIKHYPQKAHGYCTVHALMSLFQSDFFERYLEDPEFAEKGCSDEKLLQITQEYDANVGWFDVGGVADAYGIPLPPEFVWHLISHNTEKPEDNVVIPYLLSVKKGQTFFHSVSVWNYEGRIILFEPLYDKWIVIDDWTDLAIKLREVYTIKRPLFHENRMAIVLKAEKLGISLEDLV